jgi:hypothetical protein
MAEESLTKLKVTFGGMMVLEHTAGKSVCLTYLNSLAYRFLAIFLTSPFFKVLKKHVPFSLSIFEASLSYPWDDVSLAVCGLYECGKLFQ